MAIKKNTQKDSREKLELAQRIADNSQRVVRTYASVENTIITFLRRIFGLLNKVVFDSKFSKFAALIIAVVIYFSVNADSNNSLGVTQASQISDIPVQIIYNSEIYEISGIPATADVIVMGDMSDINLQKSQVNSRLTADLSGLTEGTYTVKLTPTNFISRLSVNVIDSPSVSVVIKKKTTSMFNISYEFINTKNMSNIYSLGIPTFDTTQVRVRASQDTIDQISMVKALIDVTGVSGTFTKDARLVAYDQQGQQISCDIIPEKVVTTVTVSSPSKDTPIIVRPTGIMAEGLAIDSITLDYSTVTIYGPENILEMIDAIYIDLDVSSITSDTSVSTALNLPSGASAMSITKVNMEIKVGELTTKIIEKVPLEWINNTGNYKCLPTNIDDAYINVLVSGTANNLAAINVNNVKVEMDVANVVVGTQSVPLIARGDNGYVTYAIADGRTEIEIQVTEG
ncbi:MAG: hypothetical protein IJS38_02820 [Erysipelotrichaceae bacterium]|nr:hypothetical protein [Erysipelotrichaceae bacterium]MBQ7223484.1 hypothetical protein [Erysipelotrichaceae bacterium]